MSDRAAPPRVSSRSRNRKCQTACKPGSVPRACTRIDGHSSGTSVAGRLARPTRTAARKPAWPPKSCDWIGPPSLLGLAPGGVYPATPVAGGAVRSYRTLSPLPAEAPKGRSWRFAFCGTFPGVAPAGRYPAPCFRGARTFLPRPRRKRRFRRQPSGRLARQYLGILGAWVNSNRFRWRGTRTGPLPHPAAPTIMPWVAGWGSGPVRASRNALPPQAGADRARRRAGRRSRRPFRRSASRAGSDAGRR